MAAQIAKVREELGSDLPVRVDSHQHYHMIPFVFEALLELRERSSISYVRLPREPFFRCGPGTRSWANYLGPNLLKHLLLNGLSRSRGPRLAAAGIDHCHTLIGVLFTGNMGEAAVRSAMARVPRNGRNGMVEVLFHPGGARPGEETLWAGRPDLAQYYLSPWRHRERETVKSSSFQGLMRLLRAAGQDPPPGSQPDGGPSLGSATPEGWSSATSVHSASTAPSSVSPASRSCAEHSEPGSETGSSRGAMSMMSPVGPR